jgi:hypothetical protein
VECLAQCGEQSWHSGKGQGTRVDRHWPGVRKVMEGATGLQPPSLFRAEATGARGHRSPWELTLATCSLVTVTHDQGKTSAGWGGHLGVWLGQREVSLW